MIKGNNRLEISDKIRSEPGVTVELSSTPLRLNGRVSLQTIERVGVRPQARGGHFQHKYEKCICVAI